MRPKRELLRVVRTVEGAIVFDPTGKKSGRGAYLCPDPACLEQALKAKRLAAALKTEIDPETVARLRDELAARVPGQA